MSASPEFYKLSPVFSPCGSPLVVHAAGGEAGAPLEEYCRTPTGGESQLKVPGTCPPAPRKPQFAAAACRKRLFEVEVISLQLEELERLFRPCDKRRRL